ncbi:hypothetical protein [Hyalangium gracile]|uniref:hypothetical protein n=1 Tax=Hyalangium gracile TaxID=394092 RepID=UPI001CCF3BD7|nr:hypothetical protein [Hyalangium gracile]
MLELAWSDTEERLQGSLHPDTPREGVPLRVRVHVGSFAGEDFEGPVTLTLREVGATHGQTATVTRAKGEVNWVAEFTPEKTGPHQLDVSFRTTRLKVLHADIDVVDRPIPRFFLWAIVGLAATLALAYGIRSVVRKEAPAAPHPILDEEPTVPQAAPSALTEDTSPNSAPTDTPSSTPPEKPSTL